VPAGDVSQTKQHRWSHAYYVKVGITDVDKMRSDAAREAAGDSYRPEGACSIIHHHRLTSSSPVPADGRWHEVDAELIDCSKYEHEEFHTEGCREGGELGKR
jgi:hypothetical protein